MHHLSAHIWAILPVVELLYYCLCLAADDLKLVTNFLTVGHALVEGDKNWFFRREADVPGGG